MRPPCAHSQAALLVEWGKASCPPRHQAWWPATQLTAARSKPSGLRGIPIPREQSGTRGLISPLPLRFSWKRGEAPIRSPSPEPELDGRHPLRCVATSVNHLSSFVLHVLPPPVKAATCDPSHLEQHGHRLECQALDHKAERDVINNI